VTFQQEFVLARIRQRSSVLIPAQIALFICVFVLSFLSGKVFDSWITLSVEIAVALVAVIFWLLPTWKYATTYVDVTTTRIVQRGGFFARVQREVSNSQISAVEHSRKLGVVLTVSEAEPMVLAKTPKSKELAEELRRTLAK
jgi:membrane protein YdbS with pleckstrin-like domain